MYNKTMIERLDIVLTKYFEVSSRTKAQRLIEEGLVLVNGKVETKVSLKVEANEVELLPHENYVSRGAYKLLGAIQKFGIKFSNKIVLDVGASTGGFTQVALKDGASKVYAVDVGKGELDKALLQDKRVVNLENTDVRELSEEQVPTVDIIIGDLSFISLTKILPKLKELFGNDKEMMFLFKPQFECGKEIAKKYRGIIKNKDIHIDLLKNFINFTKLLGFSVSDIIYSPIKGGDGNIEYLIYFNGKEECKYNIKNICEEAFSGLR